MAPMVDWVLTAGLQNLRSQINARWPNRDKASDGSIGDAAHAAGVSGHNPDDSPYDNAEWDGDSDSTPEVRAIDVDTDFRESGTTAQMVVDHIRRLPNVASVLRYIIYNRKIYKASNGWAAESYSGPSPHTEHIHFSGAYSQASDNNTSFNYRLEEVGDMALTVDDADVIINRIGTRLRNAAADAAPTDEFVKYMRAVAWNYQGNGLQSATSSLAALADTQTIKATLTTLATTVAGLGDVDETALANALVAPLTAAVLAGLPDSDLTPADVELAVRNVLRAGVGTDA